MRKQVAATDDLRQEVAVVTLPSCRSCGRKAQYVEKAAEKTANGHPARRYRCTNPRCEVDTFLGGPFGP